MELETQQSRKPMSSCSFCLYLTPENSCQRIQSNTTYCICSLLSDETLCVDLRTQHGVLGGQPSQEEPFRKPAGLPDKAIVEWRGKCGLWWHGLLQLLFGESQCLPPHVLVIHLGGNDLSFVKGKALVLQAIRDMCFIRERWPFVKLIWSAMLPRQVWRCGCEPHILNRAHRWVNNKIRKAMNGGHICT
ncbi:uncharacterized protein LOC121929711 isoform X2 [Sceloporus undulatus]|uniref:uncharacterized protein LOC121929711 isoform X2 n=1 Tax=Sceloporus undulatus TaxID=8520 RepID=UPI001C4D83C0|nr:uncharacterized protein LOC121929711 isoform X2 [Sceloporus undulatus]